MNYIALEDYRKAWIFRHRELPVSEQDLAEIKPLTPQRAEQVWNLQISENSLHPSEPADGDWMLDKSVWQEEQGHWESAWDSDSNELPERLAEHLNWEDETLVWFCYDNEHIIETRWAVFRRNWKNFLFMDDGPLLIGRKRKQVVQFFENGHFRVGTRI
ncbi:MAG: DUF2947 domain-containing protein [Marinobacterium sp.]|nr:DUF2947 domain-containing protein [Marinobacterium sp.]